LKAIHITMKNKIVRLLIILAVVFLFYFVFILFGGISSYFKNDFPIVACCTTFYLITIFFLVKVFNRLLNNISLSDYFGKNHLRATLISTALIVFSFFLPTLAVTHFDFSFQPVVKIFESSFEFVVVSISEELVFRAFLFLSILLLSRNVLLSAVLVSLLFTVVHYNSIENITHFLWVFVTSMLMTYLYVYTKSIVSPITFHFLINLLNENIIIQINIDHLLIVGQFVCMILCVFLLWFLSNRKNNFDLIGNK